MPLITITTTIKRLVKDLVAAEIANSWKGGGDPADIPAIEQAVAEARHQLKDYLESCRENKR